MLPDDRDYFKYAKLGVATQLPPSLPLSLVQTKY